MKLDAEGWLEIDELIRRANAQGQRLTRDLLDEVVTTSDKARFAVGEDGTRIRANQGHSVVGVDLQLEPVKPPDVLFHGTVAAVLPLIQQQGLRKQSRNHVHLSVDEKTAMKVGARRGKPIILRIDAITMHAQGHIFYCSANGVWLVDSVPREYLEFPA